MRLNWASWAYDHLASWSCPFHNRRVHLAFWHVTDAIQVVIMRVGVWAIGSVSEQVTSNNVTIYFAMTAIAFYTAPAVGVFSCFL